MKVYQKIAALIGARNTCEKSGNVEWFDRHSESLQKIERDILPSGSGFNSGCFVILAQSSENKIVIQADFHAMDENGFYCGWKEYKVVVTPSLSFGFNLKIIGRDYRGLKDYIADVFNNVLNREFSE